MTYNLQEVFNLDTLTCSKCGKKNQLGYNICPFCNNNLQITTEKDIHIFKGEHVFLKYTMMFFKILTILEFTFIVPVWIPYMTKEPIPEIPISISPPGSVDVNFHVNAYKPYDLNFLFSKSTNTQEQFDKVITGWAGPQSGRQDGVPIPVSWEIYSLDREQYVFHEEVITEKRIWSAKDTAARTRVRTESWTSKE